MFVIIFCGTWWNKRILISSIFGVKKIVRTSWPRTIWKQISQVIWEGSQRENSGRSWILEGRRQESQMKSSPVTRLNILATHSLKLWIGKTGIIKSWSQDTGMVRNGSTKFDERKNRIKYHKLCSPSWWMGYWCAMYKVQKLLKRDLKQETLKTRINYLGKAQQVIIVFKLRAKKDKAITRERGILTRQIIITSFLCKTF